MENNYPNQPNPDKSGMVQRILNDIPIMAVTNALRMTPCEHEGGIYYYDGEESGVDFKLCVNTTRRQWYADKGNHGDDAISLVSYLGKAGVAATTGGDLMESFAVQIARDIRHALDTPQRIQFKPMPIRGRKWVAKPYARSINKPFIRGISAAVLEKYCHVVYRANCKAGEEDEETMRLYDLICNTKDLRQLTPGEKEAIRKKFTTAIALRNANGGLQLYTGEFSYPEKNGGYCLFGGDEVKPGEKLYIYENILDYLAMMEQWHKNSTEAIMQPSHHLIINGDENLADALDYIHERCDYLDVVCLFPNDRKGHSLFEKVHHATRDTAQDASQRMYISDRYFSLFAKNAAYFNHKERTEYAAAIQQAIDK